MHLIQYIKAMQHQPDSTIELLRNKFTDDANFPETSDINILANYVWDKLNNQQTTAYQNILMMWGFESRTPFSLDDLNLIIDVQDKLRK
jgi:hypothetical protein